MPLLPVQMQRHRCSTTTSTRVARSGTPPHCCSAPSTSSSSHHHEEHPGRSGTRQASLHSNSLSAAQARQQGSVSRRHLVGLVLLAGAATCTPPALARIAVETAPDQTQYDPADPQLREAGALLQRGLNATDVAGEEAIWTQIIDEYSSLDAPWVPDVVGRAYGNRGNARSRQGKLDAALQDYNKSIEICPWSVDPVLNRGVVYEALGRFEDAITDYRTVLEVAPQDPAAWNNLGNASGGLGRWEDAKEYYAKAASLAPVTQFSFASANKALAMFQLGESEASIREMRGLLRRYMDFQDMRAALAAALWSVGREADAETNWERVEDPRYRDRRWLREERRWPPRLVESLEAFLDLRSL